jgi:ribosome maturation factor RimP
VTSSRSRLTTLSWRIVENCSPGSPNFWHPGLTDRTTQDEELAVATGLPSQTQVTELLDDEFARAGYEIEDVVIDERSRPPRITVIAVGDTALNLDTVAALSRSASDLLDEKRDIAGTYVLEVSSPGIDRPLTTEKHFRRARGRKVDLTLTDGTQVSGRVGEIRDGTLDVVIRDGRDWAVRPIPLSDAAKAVVQVEFSQAPQRELELAGVDRVDRSAETEGTT